MSNKQARIRRGKKTKFIINQFGSNRQRLVVFRSNKNITAQIVKKEAQGDIVLVRCSTVDNNLKNEMNGNKVDQAFLIGKRVAEIALEKGITEVAFDRSGYRYHGRVKAVAAGAREAGLVI
ncbi:MAG: 50S ribosomal protein L18 [Legionellaceae bacterium]|nr:50S ribosomal protein L18 [Legionellaceae bacterium]